MKEKIAIVVAAVILLVLVGAAVHKTDKWYYARHEDALAAERVREQKAEDAAAKADATKKYNTCVGSQNLYDKQTAAIKAKTVRPVCVAPTN